MSDVKTKRSLRDLALLYLSLGQSSEEYPSQAVQEAVVDNLHQRYADLPHADVQDVVLDILASCPEGKALTDAASVVIATLGERLTVPKKRAVLQDLARIARMDGVLLEQQRLRLTTLAEQWGVELPRKLLASNGDMVPQKPTEEYLVHLAFLYLVMAQAPDSEMNEDERLLIFKKLQHWMPDEDERQVRFILEEATKRYVEGARENLPASLQIVKEALTEAQRKTALNDLVQIANADDIFLDSEEDLLNEIMAAWDVDALGSSLE